ncbi:MAG: lysyl-tRNA synthetase [Betaproteobacteria bacterium]|nr:lysyl-tRNA synthetase [Betaproteobacteria bacterium]
MSDQPVTPEAPAAPEVDENQIIAERRAKLAALRAKGNAYPNQFQRDHASGDLIELYEDRDRDWLDLNPVVVKMAGRIMLKRVMGKASFAQLQDSRGMIQLYITDSYPGKEQHAEFKHFDIGDIIGVDGVLFKTKTNELTVRVKNLLMLAKSLRPLPEKFHGLTNQEQRYRQRYLDLIANEDTRLRFVQRSNIIQAIRNFFLGKRYLEVETPMMHPIPGGASARPFMTHHNALDMQLYLRIAPELYLKRLVVGGFEKVFEINRNFRNEGISTRHNPEFTMLEFYCAHRDYRYLMVTIEEMIRFAALKALGVTTIKYQGREIDLMKPYARLTIAEAIKKYHPDVTDDALKSREALIEKLNALKITFRPQDGIYGLQLTLFENTVETELFEPTFIHHYPAEVSPLARRDDNDPDFTERFELYVAGRELANGFSELNDPEDQAQRFLEQAKQKDAGDHEAMHYDADYIRALEYGLPPTAGAGIGIDRLVMLLTDSASIRDVILFPQMRPE